MARKPPRPVYDVPTFLDAHGLHASDSSFKDEWIRERRPSSLLREFLNVDSDFLFVDKLHDDLHRKLGNLGFSSDPSWAIVREVLQTPSFAISDTTTQPARVRQAVIIDKDESIGLEVQLAVSIEALAASRHVPMGSKIAVPGEVRQCELSVDLVDLEDDESLIDSIRMILGWASEIPQPRRSQRTRPNSVVFLGDLKRLGCADTPDEWRIDLDRLSDAFGLSSKTLDESTFSGSSANSTWRIFRFDPYTGTQPRDVPGPSRTVVDIDTRTSSYGAIFRQIALEMALKSDWDQHESSRARKLNPGEHVFHRKTGNNPRRDNFDQGTTKPCIHGEESFIRFSGDKSLKGMAHIYSNFEDSWLYHCKKYPNCNVYAVFAPNY